MQLTLGSPRTNSTNAQHICKELRRNGIKHLASEWHSKFGKVNEQLSTNPKPPVNLERSIDIRIIDEPLPPNGSARLFKVGAHHNEKLVLVLLLEGEKATCVLE